MNAFGYFALELAGDNPQNCHNGWRTVFAGVLFLLVSIATFKHPAAGAG